MTLYAVSLTMQLRQCEMCCLPQLLGQSDAMSLQITLGGTLCELVQSCKMVVVDLAILVRHEVDRTDVTACVDVK
jgi:hypothetical protein